MKAPGKVSAERIELLSRNQRRLVMLGSRLFPDWMAKQAEAVLTRPRRRRGRAGEVLDALARRRDLALGDARLATWSLGDVNAPRVVLTHGWGGYGAQLLPFARALLAQGYGVDVFDHLGHGESDGRGGALPDFIAGLGAVIAAGPQPFAIVAHSMGGAAALQAVRNGSPCSALVVIGAPASFDIHLKTLSRRVGLGGSAQRSLRKRLERRYVPVAELDRLDLFPVERTRAMFVHDRDDREVAFAHVETLHHAWRGSRMLATEGLGHHRILRDPGVVEAVAAFIAGT